MQKRRFIHCVGISLQCRTHVSARCKHFKFAEHGMGMYNVSVKQTNRSTPTARGETEQKQLTYFIILILPPSGGMAYGLPCKCPQYVDLCFLVKVTKISFAYANIFVEISASILYNRSCIQETKWRRNSLWTVRQRKPPPTHRQLQVRKRLSVWKHSFFSASSF